LGICLLEQFTSIEIALLEQDVLFVLLVQFLEEEVIARLPAPAAPLPPCNPTLLTRVQEELDGATQQQLAHCTYRSSRCVCGMCRWTTGMDAATRAGARVLNNLVNHLATQGDTESA
jgi:hypothetical protein